MTTFDSMEEDPQHLQRFVTAQEQVFDNVVEELRRGKKVTHWMWFVFPQVEGLGRSSTSQHFAIHDLSEARAYLDHPVLGKRLRTCVALVNELTGQTAHEVFGAPDDLKFFSSMTLFAIAHPQEALFQRALDKYFDGQRDPLTLEKLTVATRSG